MVARPTLHILGCGRAGRVVARRMLQTGRIAIGSVKNRSLHSAREAVTFIGAGTATDAPFIPDRGDWLMIGLPDGRIEAVAQQFAMTAEPAPALAFHLSGSLPAGALSALRCPVASVHPLLAFAEPQRALEAFDGAWCVVEGDASALQQLQPVLEAAAARVAHLRTDNKRGYHAATVAASNYLVTLHDFALRLAGDAGLDPGLARALLCDLQATTLANVRALGASAALTGPVERNDVETCRAMLDALPSEARPLFAALGLATVALGRRRYPERDWRALEALFGRAGA